MIVLDEVRGRLTSTPPPTDYIVGKRRYTCTVKEGTVVLDQNTGPLHDTKETKEKLQGRRGRKRWDETGTSDGTNLM